MPTTLPPRRRADEIKRSLTRIIFDVVFNTALVVSALILTFIVLVREEQYAFGRSPLQLIQQSPVDTTGESQIIPPSN
ncbi:MAG TPA: hypothetical protein VGF53_13715 [Pseudolabrys sp.]